MRDGDALELIKENGNAFVLLTVIAFRAQRTAGYNAHNLLPGEAFVGDLKSLDMTERGYRTAKLLLEKRGFATFKATSKGTIARLINTRVFDVNAEQSDEQSDEQPTSNRRASDEQVTTTKNGRTERMRDGKDSLARRERANELLALFGEAFKKRFKANYAADVRDSMAAAHLLERVPDPKQIVATFEGAWLAKGYWGGRCQTLSKCCSRYTDLLAEVVAHKARSYATTDDTNFAPE